MKYQIKVPGDWIVIEQLAFSTISIVQLLLATFPDRPIPATAFFQLVEHREFLISIGWLVEVES